jgi:hypothetical protein
MAVELRSMPTHAIGLHEWGTRIFAIFARSCIVAARANRRSFDYASRDKAARGFAQEDNCREEM